MKRTIFSRSSSCRHLHPQDLKQMKFLTTSYFIDKNDFSSAMKAAAFLAAIKRGARFIYHANPGKKNNQKILHLKFKTLAKKTNLKQKEWNQNNTREHQISVHYNSYQFIRPWWPSGLRQQIQVGNVLLRPRYESRLRINYISVAVCTVFNLAG